MSRFVASSDAILLVIWDAILLVILVAMLPRYCSMMCSDIFCPKVSLTRDIVYIISYTLYWIYTQYIFKSLSLSVVYILGTNSLCPDDVIWRQRYRSTLAQVMACCLKAPSHYLNQCLLINKLLWPLSEGNFTSDNQTIHHKKVTWKLLI